MDLSRLREVLKHPEFRRLLGARALGQTGDGLLQAALATFELFSPERAPTAAKVAVAFAILLLPYSVLGPFLGTLIDRWSRRTILVRGNLLRVAVIGALWVVLKTGQTGFLLALVVLIALGVARFVLTTLAASLPHTVAAESLVTANAITPTTGTICATIGGLVGLGLRQVIGGDQGSLSVLAVAGLAYVAAAVVSRGFGHDQLGPTGPKQELTNVVSGLGNGWIHLRSRPQARRAIAVVSLQRCSFGALTAIAVILLRTEIYRPDQTGPALAGMAAVTGTAAFGAFAAAVWTPRLVRRIGIPRWSTITLAMAGLIVPFGVLATSLPGLLLTALAIGFAGQAVKVCADTLVQRQVDDVHRGRVFSIYDMSVNVFLVAGVTAVAIVAGRARIPGIVGIGVAVLLGLTATLASRRSTQPD